MNKQVLVALLTAVAALSFTAQLSSESQASVMISEWSAWKSKHSKVYESEEEAFRFAIFNNNYITVQELNAELEDSTVGLNKFSDLTKEEFRSMYLGYKKNPEAEQLPLFVPENIETPQSVDWVAKGGVVGVKDQGQCGSCWAFGTVGGIEGGYFVAGNTLTSFSEQQINSCDTVDGGCNGGDLPTAYNYVNGAGLATEAEYPYTSGGGTTGKCKSSKHPVSLSKGAVSGQAVKTKSRDAFLSALATQPLSICIEADSNVFQGYTGGVITSKQCGTALDHCVTAVAFDMGASKPYVTIKNSWGTSWGDNGYVKVGIEKATGKGICGIFEEPYLAKF